MEYSNPLDVVFGDPFILDNEDGTYYMYGTGGGAKDGFVTYDRKVDKMDIPLVKKANLEVINAIEN